MTIDAAKPGEAVLSKGEGGVVGWPATVVINNAERLVTVRSTGSSTDNELIQRQHLQCGMTATKNKTVLKSVSATKPTLTGDASRQGR